MTRRNFAMYAGLACAAAVLTVPAMAAGKPDFSGEWKLNVDKSNFGPVPPPTSQTRKIDHKEPTIKIVTAQNGMDGEYTTDLTYTTDGKESKNNVRGAEAKSVAKWDGDALAVDTKLDYQGMEITIKTSMKLSDDGKTINETTKIMTPQGDFDLASVLEKVTK
jgi:hypothetical protein